MESFIFVFVLLEYFIGFLNRETLLNLSATSKKIRKDMFNMVCFTDVLIEKKEFLMDQIIETKAGKESFRKIIKRGAYLLESNIFESPCFDQVVPLLEEQHIKFLKLRLLSQGRLQTLIQFFGKESLTSEDAHNACMFSGCDIYVSSKDTSDFACTYRGIKSETIPRCVSENLYMTWSCDFEKYIESDKTLELHHLLSLLHNKCFGHMDFLYELMVHQPELFEGIRPSLYFHRSVVSEMIESKINLVFDHKCILEMFRTDIVKEYKFADFVFKNYKNIHKYEYRQSDLCCQSDFYHQDVIPEVFQFISMHEADNIELIRSLCRTKNPYVIETMSEYYHLRCFRQVYKEVKAEIASDKAILKRYNRMIYEDA